MSFLKISGFLVMLAVGVMFPHNASAQLMRNLFNNPCCNTCKQQVCCCSTTRPVVETRMRQQQCLTYRDEKRIGCKTEPFCETVPVTKVDCVTVDEGCYKMVWVPRPVTKAIPRTEMHQRVSYRQVPYEFCERVPMLTTRLVPEQTIRYVTEHRSITTTPPVPLCPPPPCPPANVCPPVSACPPGGFGAPYGIPSVVPGMGMPHMNHMHHNGLLGPSIGTPAGYGGPSPVAVPYSAMRGQSPDEPTTATAGLVPDARYADPAFTVTPRTAATVPTQQLKYAETIPVTRPVSATMRAPTAASVWQTPRRTP